MTNEDKNNSDASKEEDLLNFSEEELLKNKQIIDRITKICNDNHLVTGLHITFKKRNQNNLPAVSFSHIDSSVYGDDKNKLQPPFYQVVISVSDYRRETNRSRYGNLPRVVLGSDGEPYFIHNNYYFEINTNRVFVEEVIEPAKYYEDEPIEDFLKDMLFDDLNSIKKLDFIPTESHSYKKLNSEDYEKIEFGIKAIETNELTLKK